MMFKITNKRGVTLCFQKAPNATLAVEFARMYGHRRAVAAEAV